VKNRHVTEVNYFNYMTSGKFWIRLTVTLSPAELLSSTGNTINRFIITSR